MAKIAVMGDYDSIYGFAALGLTTFAVDPEDAEAAIKEFKSIITGGHFGVIYVTEQLAVVLHDEIARYEAEMTPAIIQIPGVVGNTGDGVASVRRSVEQAVGSDILFGKK
ncbi:MAG: V-type ATP synthase subunit F [Lachnospiraceae bacterium]|nr:V-type ATP synthase subunit F [Lachnospiraceae bacterium]